MIDGRMSSALRLAAAIGRKVNAANPELSWFLREVTTARLTMCALKASGYSEAELRRLVDLLPDTETIEAPEAQG